MLLRVGLVAVLAMLAGGSACSGALSVDAGGGWRLALGEAEGVLLLVMLTPTLVGVGLFSWWFSFGAFTAGLILAFVFSFVLGVYLLLLAEWVITAIVDYPEVNLTGLFIVTGFILALLLFVSFYIAARQAGRLDQKW